MKDENQKSFWTRMNADEHGFFLLPFMLSC